MNEEKCIYRIGIQWKELIVPFAAAVLFGGFTYWMYKSDNALYFFPLLITVVTLIPNLYLLYSCLFLRIEVCEHGFRHYYKPFQCRTYRYEEITKAWDAGDKLPPQSKESYFHYTAIDGTTARFRYRIYHADAVLYMIDRINGKKPEDNTEYDNI